MAGVRLIIGSAQVVGDAVNGFFGSANDGVKRQRRYSTPSHSIWGCEDRAILLARAGENER